MDKPPEVTQAEWDTIIASNMTFDEIETKWGREVAIEAGIARDPDAEEWTAEDFARARPAIEVVPDLVEHSIRRKMKNEESIQQCVIVRLDGDLVLHFLSGGPGWQTRLNETLRRAVFGS